MTHNPAPVPLLIDVKQAARLLSISDRSLHRLAKAGELPCVRLGHRVLFNVESLKARLAALEAAGQGGGT